MVNKDSINKATQELADTLIRKNQDYGDSVKEQFDTYGLTSILIRLDDKLRRLKTLAKNPHNQQVLDESIKDTLKDMAGYATLGSICLGDSSLEKLDTELATKLGNGLLKVTTKPQHHLTPGYDMNFRNLPARHPNDWEKQLLPPKPHPYLDPDDQH